MGNILENEQFFLGYNERSYTGTEWSVEHKLHSFLYTKVFRMRTM